MPDAATAEAEPNLARIVSSIAEDAMHLVQQQAALVRAEIRQDLRTARTAAILFAAALCVSSTGLCLLAFMGAYGLAAAFPDLPMWACFGAVGCLFLALSGILAYVAKHKLEFIGPEKSKQAMKETMQWLTSQK